MSRLSCFGPVVVLAAFAVACDFPQGPTQLEVERLDPVAESLIPESATFEHLAGDFGLLEGPVWSDEGYLLFSDLARHLIYRWSAPGQVSTYLKQRGWDEALPRGPNGLAFDHDGRLVICQHGMRTVVRQESDGSLTVLADRFEGRRLNSPNDLAIRSDGRLYFTDPPVGLKGGHDNPDRELDFSGIYVYFEDELRLLSSSLSSPNGIALSPDEKFIYVSNSDARSPVVMRLELGANGELIGDDLFFDFSHLDVSDSLDGIETDEAGNVYVTSTAGIHVFNSAGKPLATIKLPHDPHNIAWGDADRQSLYVTAQSSLYRLRFKPDDESN